MKPEHEWGSTEIAEHMERLRRLDGAACADLSPESDAERLQRIHQVLGIALGMVIAAGLVLAWAALAPAPAEAVEWPCEMGVTCDWRM